MIDQSSSKSFIPNIIDDLLVINEEEEEMIRKSYVSFLKCILQKLKMGKTFYIAGVSWTDSQHFSNYQSFSTVSLPVPFPAK